MIDPRASVRVTSVTANDMDTWEHEVVTVVRPDFTSFYRAAYGEVAKALVVTLGNADLGREAADEAMARCYARWSVVQHYDNPSGWVYRVGLNWARSRLRRAARWLALDRPEPVTMPAVADPQIHAALGELTFDLRSIVVCRLLLDWSTAETADALNLRPGTVKSRLSRAKAQLEMKLDHMRLEA